MTVDRRDRAEPRRAFTAGELIHIQAECVSMPCCGFTYDAIYSLEDGTYTCPNCAEDEVSPGPAGSTTGEKTCGCGHPVSRCAPERCSHPFASNARGMGDQP